MVELDEGTQPWLLISLDVARSSLDGYIIGKRSQWTDHSAIIPRWGQWKGIHAVIVEWGQLGAIGGPGPRRLRLNPGQRSRR